MISSETLSSPPSRRAYRNLTPSLALLVEVGPAIIAASGAVTLVVICQRAAAYKRRGMQKKNAG